jgi:thiamine biosynthesis lipoprotein
LPVFLFVTKFTDKVFTSVPPTRCFLVLCFLMNGGVAAQPVRFQFTEPKMGSPFHLIFYTADSAHAQLLARETFNLVDSLNAIYSDYLPSSELNALSATAGADSFVSVSPLLYHLLHVSKKEGQKSRQAFDITIGPLSKCWREARKEKRIPSAKEIEAARKLTGLDKLAIDTATKKIKLLQKGMELDLGGIAKGHVAQKAVEFLQAKGVVSVMAAASGDIVCGAPPPGKKGWAVGINAPGETEKLLNTTLQMRNRAVSTSGDVYQFTEHQGIRYSHIIDPRTGYGVTFQRNVTVIARDGTTADWLATACSILPVNQAKKLARKTGAHLLVTQQKGKKLRMYSTRKMKQYLKGRIW